MQKHLYYVLALLISFLGLTACESPSEKNEHEQVVTKIMQTKDSLQAKQLIDSLKKVPSGHFPSRAELKSTPIDPPRN